MPYVRKNYAQYVGNDIIEKVLNADLPALYGISDITELKRLFTLLAYNTGKEINVDQLSQIAGISKPTIKKYIEYLLSLIHI